MTQQTKIGQPFPGALVKILDNPATEPGRPDDGRWQLVVIYRGLHCPICKAYLSQLETIKHEFDKINVDVIAISTDPEEKARQFRDDNNLSFAVGYGLSIPDARALGLFISAPLSSAETDQPFSEPGTYLVRPDGTIQIIDVANAPFSRPDLQMLKSGIAFIQKQDYPPRGLA